MTIAPAMALDSLSSTLANLPVKAVLAQLESVAISLIPESSRSALLAWFPDAQTIYSDLTILLPEDDEAANLRSFQGTNLGDPTQTWFRGFNWARFTAQHWEVALISVAAYIVMIPTFKWMVAKNGKWDVRDFAFYWNAGLSIFSWFGVFACVPVLLSGFSQHGLYYTTCAPSHWYSNGVCGLFVVLFIYSKVFELIDTVLLTLAQKPVIALQWWHHSTVLLYCWHSCCANIATGLWFAAMNYSVHSVMYGYFALTATKYRKLVTPFAMFITLAQLLQMVVGMYVTTKAVLYQAEGLECHVNKTNSILGLSMYFSYFVLFFKLFVDNYFLKKKNETNLPAKSKSGMLKLVRSATNTTMKDLSPSAGSDDINKKSD